MKQGGSNLSIIHSYDVVLPIKNGEQFIVEALNSILGQTIRPQSIYVVNDGSTDRSAELVSNLIFEASKQDVELKWLESDGIGVSAARNFGIKHCTADLIALLDCDDVWLKNKIEKQIPLLQDNVLVHCGYELMDVQGKALLEKVETQKYSRLKLFQMEYQVTGSASGVIFKRKDFLRTWGFDTNLRYAEDYDLWLQFALIGEVKCVPEILLKIRKHSKSTQGESRNYIKRIEELYCLIYVWRKHYESIEFEYADRQCEPPLKLWVKWFFLETKFKLFTAMKFFVRIFGPKNSNIKAFLIYVGYSKKRFWLTYLFTIFNVICVKLEETFIIRTFKKIRFILRITLQKIKKSVSKSYSDGRK